MISESFCVHKCKMLLYAKCLLSPISYSTIVTVLEIMKIRNFDGFLAKNLTPKPASQYLHGTLAILVSI